MKINSKVAVGTLALANVSKTLAAPTKAGAIDLLERAATSSTCPATATAFKTNTSVLTAPVTSTVTSTVRPTTTNIISIPTGLVTVRPTSTVTKTAQATVTQPVTATQFAPITQTQTAQATLTIPVTVTQTQNITNAQTATVSAFVTNVVTGTQTSTATVPGNTVTVPGNTVTVDGNTVTIPGQTTTVAGNTVTVDGGTITVIAEPTVTPSPTTSTSLTSTSVSASSSASPTADLNAFVRSRPGLAWTNSPDAEHITFLFTGLISDNPCERVAEGAAPYIAGYVYVQATLPNAALAQPYQVETFIGTAPGIEGPGRAFAVQFDANCVPTAPTQLSGFSFQRTGGEWQFEVAGQNYTELHVFDPYSTTSNSLYGSAVNTDNNCVQFPAPPAFVSANCDTNPIGSLNG